MSITATAPLVVSPRNVGLYGTRCSCFQLHRPTSRCGKSRKAERRTVKRTERIAVRAEIREALAA